MWTIQGWIFCQVTHEVLAFSRKLNFWNRSTNKKVKRGACREFQAIGQNIHSWVFCPKSPTPLAPQGTPLVIDYWFLLDIYSTYLRHICMSLLLFWDGQYVMITIPPRLLIIDQDTCCNLFYTIYRSKSEFGQTESRPESQTQSGTGHDWRSGSLFHNN